jgi:hypothetical protein
MTRLVGLYPRGWRDRYEAEFLALLSERPPDPLDRIDIVRGAVDARLHPQRNGVPDPHSDDPIPYNGPWSASRAGWITLAGGFLWLATIAIALNSPVVTDSWGTYRDASAALPSFFISLVLLGIGVWAVAATVPSTARVARAAALVAGLAGLLWAFAPWVLWAGFIMSVGISILAIGAARTARWRRSDAALLVVAVAAAWGSVLIATSMFTARPGSTLDSYDAQFLFLAILGSIWFATAHALLRPARPIAAPVDASRPG